MPISEQAVDLTFNEWWKQFGRTSESIPRALERTRLQIGGGMPPNYVPPPHRQRTPFQDGPGTLSGFMPPGQSRQPPIGARPNAIPLVMGTEEILRFLRDARPEPVEGIFLPNASDEQTEKMIRKALEGLLQFSALGESSARRELANLMTEEEQQWLHPELVRKLNRLPCLTDPAKQAARDLEVFKKFWNVDARKWDINENFLQRMREKHMLRYLEDWNFLRKNSIAGGAYGAQRLLKDKGHEHAMRVAIAAQSAFNVANRYSTAKQPATHWNTTPSGRDGLPSSTGAIPGRAPNGGTPTRPPDPFYHSRPEREPLPPMERSW